MIHYNCRGKVNWGERKKESIRRKRIWKIYIYYIWKIYKDIENLKSQKESRKFYQLVNNIRVVFNPETITCKNRNENLIQDFDEVLVHWREHFQESLNG